MVPVVHQMVPVVSQMVLVGPQMVPTGPQMVPVYTSPHSSGTFFCLCICLCLCIRHHRMIEDIVLFTAIFHMRGLA